MKYGALKPNHGVTLVELMVAMVLSLVLMASVIQVFIAHKSTYQLSEEMAGMQEAARYAADVLASSIRMAGFMGCSGRNINTAILNRIQGAANTFTPERGIEGWESPNTSYGNYPLITDAPVTDISNENWATADNAVLDADTRAVGNSDILRVWHIEGDAVSGSVSGTRFISNTTPHYDANDVVMLTNCNHVDIALVCSVSGKTTQFDCALNDNSQALLNADQGRVLAYKLSGWLYYVGKRSNKATNPPALYRRPISQHALAERAQELVEGVESIQLLYGVAGQYVEAGSVDDWNNVVSVQVELLLQSQSKNLVDSGQTFHFNGAEMTANDGRLRYPSMTTATLRNRVQ
jgi:type IV pilus assembly protein PilW